MCCITVTWVSVLIWPHTSNCSKQFVWDNQHIECWHGNYLYGTINTLQIPSKLPTLQFKPRTLEVCHLKQSMLLSTLPQTPVNLLSVAFHCILGGAWGYSLPLHQTPGPGHHTWERWMLNLSNTICLQHVILPWNLVCNQNWAAEKNNHHTCMVCSIDYTQKKNENELEASEMSLLDAESQMALLSSYSRQRGWPHMIKMAKMN